MKNISHLNAQTLLRDKRPLPLDQQRQLNQHLKHCQECSNYAQMIDRIAREMGYHWKEPVVTPAEKAKVMARLTQSKPVAFLHPFWMVAKYVGYAGSMAALMAALLFTFIRLIPSNGQYTNQEDLRKSVGRNPAPLGYSILAEQDLNCDGNQERLMINREIVPRISSELPIITGVFLETITESGAKNIWTRAWENASPEIFLNPQILKYDQCTTFITLPSRNLDLDQNRIAIYSITGEEVELVLYTAGVLKNVAEPTMYAEDGLCEVKLKTYRWNANTLLKLDEKLTTIPCSQE